MYPTDICVPLQSDVMYQDVSTLFVVVKHWKQSKYLSAEVCLTYEQ